MQVLLICQSCKNLYFKSISFWNLNMMSNSVSRRVLRCIHCELCQYTTANGQCRRCHWPLGVPHLNLLNQSSSSSGAISPSNLLAKRIGATIRILRQESRLSQKAFACKAGVSRPVITKLENGRSIPTLAKLQRVTAALGIDIAEVFLRMR